MSAQEEALGPGQASPAQTSTQSMNIPERRHLLGRSNELGVQRG